MNWLDIAIIVLIAALAFMGWRLGVARAVVTLVSGVVGVHWAVRLYKSIAPVFGPITENEGLQQVLAFGLVLLVALVAGWLVVTLLKALLNMLMLGWLDHLAGVVLGMGSGALIAATLLTFMDAMSISLFQEAIEESSLAPTLIESLGPVKRFLSIGEGD